ncbi:hypothetical protein HELRODRAFT_167520 [Helobdella robusta]|uniref:Acyl-ACP thioesterase n=1 Tax=Helobdella robusta TaxID=6412 RepID=T1EZG2_HELRO|nr:hypothetical protein HELRODRAFT_167520 [Helobdella robusta]ESO11002.1 hypothetical protein HELRODRAFT_167520 [Helobdella robusta]
MATGKYLPWRIYSLLFSSRRSHFEIHGVKSHFLDLYNLTHEKQYMTFFVSSRVEISQEFYRVVADLFFKRPVPYESLDVIMRIGYVGNKSASLYSCLEYDKFNYKTHKPGRQKSIDCIKIGKGKDNEKELGQDSSHHSILASNITSMVFMDGVTRQSEKPPQWWIDKYKYRSDDRLKLVNQKFSIPQDKNVFRHPVRILYNDIDFYNHTNYKSYVCYCFEIANQAVNHKFFLDGFNSSGDILNREVKLIEVSYFGESVPDDVLEVSMWIDPNDENVLKFSFDRLKDTERYKAGLVCQATVGFHPTLLPS